MGKLKIDWKSLRGYPWLPCPICKGVEGCDHPAPERARASGLNICKTDHDTDAARKSN